MNTIVLAYSDGFVSSNAIRWLAETFGADIVTMTLEVGQGVVLAVIRGYTVVYEAPAAIALHAAQAAMTGPDVSASYPSRM